MEVVRRRSKDSPSLPHIPKVGSVYARAAPDEGARPDYVAKTGCCEAGGERRHRGDLMARRTHLPGAWNTLGCATVRDDAAAIGGGEGYAGGSASE